MEGLKDSREERAAKELLCVWAVGGGGGDLSEQLSPASSSQP